MSPSNGRHRRSRGHSCSHTRKTGPDPLCPPAPGRFANQVHFDIPSDLHRGTDVRDQIVGAVEKIGFDRDCIFGIKLALDEALINAIRHGNKLNPAKHVRIDARITPKRFEVTIEDQGKGFKRTCVPDPTDDANIEKPCGRGILLIEAYMHSVKWSLGGRRVKMIRRNQPIRHT